MVAVQLSGGLGNQMFEYALYLKLKSMGKEVKIDDFTCYGEQELQRTNQLSVFGVSYERLSEQGYIGLTDSSMRPADRVRRKLLGRRDCRIGTDPAILTRRCWSVNRRFCWDIFSRKNIFRISESRYGRRSGSG